MNKWIVRYNDKNGDGCSVWTEANSKDERENIEICTKLVVVLE